METLSEPPTFVSVVLSRDEVLAILHLTDISAIPGLGDEPIPDLSAEQRAIGLIVAERALRARGLAAINAEGRLLVRSAILQMIGICAAAAQSVYMTRIVAPSGESAQLIAHQREEAWVLHTRPEPALHAFQLVDGWLGALEQIRSYCQWPDQASDQGFTLTIASKTLETVRELAANDRIREARELLVAAGNHLGAAEILVDILSQPHFVTVVQQVKTSSPDAIAIQSVTTLHRDNILLIAVEPAWADNNDSEQIVIQPVSVGHLEHFLSTMVVGTSIAA